MDHRIQAPKHEQRRWQTQMPMPRCRYRGPSTNLPRSVWYLLLTLYTSLPSPIPRGEPCRSTTVLSEIVIGNHGVQSSCHDLYRGSSTPRGFR